MEVDMPTFVVLTVLALVAAFRLLVVAAVPDLQTGMDVMFSFLEWLRDRWRRFKGG